MVDRAVIEEQINTIVVRIVFAQQELQDINNIRSAFLLSEQRDDFARDRVQCTEHRNTAVLSR